MNIAELFVKLGVKGESSLGKALKGVKKGMAETKEMSISTKAAVLGVVYGLERMMSNAAQSGTGLKQFANATGLSVKNLQVWQHAGRKFSVESGEVQGAFQGIQRAMANMIATGTQPAGMALFANAMGIDNKRITDTKYMMEQLQGYINQASVIEGNIVGESMGFSPAMIGSMRKGAFSYKNIALAQKEANIYSKEEVVNLQKIESKWDQIGHNVKIAMGRLVADQGLEFVKPIESASKGVVVLTESFLELLKTTNALKLVTTVFEGWSLLFKELSSSAKVIKSFLQIGSDKKPYRKEGGNKNLGSPSKKTNKAFDVADSVMRFLMTGSLDKSVNKNNAMKGVNAAIPRNNNMYMDRNKSSSSTYETKITINESSSPKETGGEVMKAFNRSIQSAGRMKDNGQDS